MTQELIDTAVFEELADAMGADFAAELVTTFLSDAPNMFAEMTQALATRDADAYRRAAHSIKSNAQVFGATLLADQARDIEMATMTADASALTALQTNFDQTADVLKALLDE
ncbi:MAG: Hpt domain-containing protein [Aliishimia sp.]